MSQQDFAQQITVPVLATEQSACLQAKIDQKIKPQGSLGQLETLALKLALITDEKPIQQAQMFLFAADHGIAHQGVSFAPQVFTRNMVERFVQGGAAINSLCKVNDIALHVIDAGLAEPVTVAGVIVQPVAAGTADFSKQAAMSLEQAMQAVSLGQSLVQQKIAAGCDCVLLGEMGIGNTTTASALMSAFTDYAASDCVGAGSGVDADTVALKATLIAQAQRRFSKQDSALTILSEVGGFEIGQMAGAIIGAAQAKVPVVVDGFICTAAALTAVRLSPNCADYLIYSHSSNEQGHLRLLAALNAHEPLLQLGLRLGEGTGAALAMPLLRSAQAFMAEMDTLADAGLA